MAIDAGQAGRIIYARMVIVPVLIIMQAIAIMVMVAAQIIAVQRGIRER